MDRDALWKSAKAARRLIAQSKNPRTLMSKHSPTGVAFNVAHEVIRVYLEELERKSIHGI